MTVTRVDKDPENLSFTLIADFDAPVDEVWQLWADPRQLERWWGPQPYPATVQQHDLTPGGEVTYYMTGPEGDRHHAWWRITSVDPPKSLEFVDGFAHPDGTPNPDLPVTHTHVTLTEHEGGTRMHLRAQFDSEDEMTQLLTMGMDEGLTVAVTQMDALLAP